MPSTTRQSFYGWWVVAGAFLIYLVSGSVFSAGTIFIKPLTEEFGWSRAAVSGALALGFVVGGLSAPFWGHIADRRGARAAFVPGVLLTGLLCIALGRISSLGSLYALYVLFSFASAGISLVPLSVVISKWFVRQRGRAMGIAYTGVGFGALFLLPLIGWIVAEYGWREAYAACGMTVLVVLLPVAWRTRSRPEEMGLLPDGDGPVPCEGQSDGSAAREFTLSQALRTPAFWLVAIAWIVSLAPLVAIELHQVPFMTDRGLAVERASLVAGLVLGLSIIGRIGFGLLSERFAIPVIYAACYAMMGMGIASLWATTIFGWIALVPYVVFFGIALGGAFALAGLLVADLFGTVALGQIFGMLGLAATIGGAAGITGAGALYDRLGNYEAVFAIAIALVTIGAVLMSFVRRPALPTVAAAFPGESAREEAVPPVPVQVSGLPPVS